MASKVYRALVRITHDGRVYEVGDELKELAEELCDRLVDEGSASTSKKDAEHAADEHAEHVAPDFGGAGEPLEPPPAAPSRRSGRKR